MTDYDDRREMQLELDDLASTMGWTRESDTIWKAQGWRIGIRPTDPPRLLAVRGKEGTDVRQFDSLDELAAYISRGRARGRTLALVAGGAVLLIVGLLIGRALMDQQDVAAPAVAISTPAVTNDPKFTLEPSPAASSTPIGVTDTFEQAAYLSSGYRWPYRLHVQFDGLDPTATAGDCARPVDPGRTTMKFSGWIGNLTTDRPAPNPNLKFETNMTGGATLDNLVIVVGEGQRRDAKCIDAYLYGDPTVSIPSGGKIEFTGIISSIPDPLPEPLELIVNVNSDEVADLEPQKVITLSDSQ